LKFIFNNKIDGMDKRNYTVSHKKPGITEIVRSSKVVISHH